MKKDKVSSEWVALLSSAVSEPSRCLVWCKSGANEIFNTFKSFNKVPTKK